LKSKNNTLFITTVGNANYLLDNFNPVS